MSDEKTASGALDELLDEEKATKAVDGIGAGLADALGGLLEQADVGATKFLDDVSRGFAEREEEFQRKKREREGG